MTVPTQITEAFGVNADPGTINSIPDTTSTPGAASFDKGFPVSTMTSPSGGGVPPFGQDFNGLLFQLSDVLQYLNTGQAFPFSSAVATAISGYPYGAIVASTRNDGPGFWLNITPGNSTDPDGGSPANWVPIYGYGSTAITLGGSDVTLTPKQAARYYIILTGTLTANVNVVFPALQASWLVVNACTGAFTVTTKTAGGTGVVVPQGGYAQPSGVYSEGVNVYSDFSPLSVPIDVNPTASTIAERDSSGQVHAVRLAQTAGLENPTIGSVAVQANSNDTLMRWISKANFLTQMFPSTANSVILGSLQLRFGTVTIPASGGTTVTFSTAFPTGAIGIFLTCAQANNAPGYATSLNAAGAAVDSADNTANKVYYYLAIGN